MWRVALVCCSVALWGCDCDGSGGGGPRGRTEAVTASATGAPGDQPSKHPAERPERTPGPTALKTRQPAVPGSTTATATASAASATGANEPAPALRVLTKTETVKVTRISPEGDTAEGVIAGKRDVGPLLVAVGLKQAPVEGCKPCMPAITFTLEDEFGTRLGSLGCYCTEKGVEPKVATLHDPLGNECVTLTLAKPADVKAIADQAIAAFAKRPSPRQR